MPHARWVIATTLMCTQVVGGATGFAAAALAIPVIWLAVPALSKSALLPVIAAVGLTLTTCMVTLHWKQIQWRHALPLAGLALLGIPLGNRAFDVLPTRYLKLAMGVFVGAIALRGLLRRKQAGPWTGWRRAVAMLLPLAGGVVHGAVNSGGPLVVAYGERALPEKGGFRATISFCFIPMNVYLILWHTLHGRYTAETLELAAAVGPFAAVGWVLGLFVHGRLSERVFRRAVLVLLLFLGCSTVVQSIIEVISKSGQAAAG